MKKYATRAVLWSDGSGCTFNLLLRGGGSLFTCSSWTRMQTRPKVQSLGTETRTADIGVANLQSEVSNLNCPWSDCKSWPRGQLGSPNGSRIWDKPVRCRLLLNLAQFRGLLRKRWGNSHSLGLRRFRMSPAAAACRPRRAKTLKWRNTGKREESTRTAHARTLMLSWGLLYLIIVVKRDHNVRNFLQSIVQ